MSDSTNLSALISYLKTLRHGAKYATDNDEVFAFLIALTVTTAKIMNDYPQEAARLDGAVTEAKKMLHPEAWH